jgi:hypothetical protein
MTKGSQCVGMAACRAATLKPVAESVTRKVEDIYELRIEGREWGVERRFGKEGPAYCGK